MVLPYLGTRIRLLRAFSTAFWIARGTSRAFPYPIPTTDSSSPTATSAVNEKRRPPLTTLATRLISMTRSCRSRPCGLTVSVGIFIGRVEGSESKPLELEPRLTGALGESPDPAVVAVSTAIEDARLDPGLLGALGEQLAAALRLLHRPEAANVLLGPVRRRDC